MMHIQEELYGFAIEDIEDKLVLASHENSMFIPPTVNVDVGFAILVVWGAINRSEARRYFRHTPFTKEVLKVPSGLFRSAIQDLPWYPLTP